MKKTSVFFLFCLFYGPLAAQIGKGTFLPGLDFNYSSSSQNFYSANGSPYPGKVTSTDFSVVPGLAYFVSNRLAVGINTNFSSSNNKDSFHGPLTLIPKTNSKSIGPYIRLYSQLGERVYFFLQGELTWGKANQTLRNDSSTIVEKSPTSFFQAGIRPGIVYFITHRIGFEATVGFLGFKRNNADNDLFNTGVQNTTNTFGLTLNSSAINLGLRYYFRKKETTTVTDR